MKPRAVYKRPIQFKTDIQSQILKVIKVALLVYLFTFRNFIIKKTKTWNVGIKKMKTRFYQANTKT